MNVELAYIRNHGGSACLLFFVVVVRKNSRRVGESMWAKFAAKKQPVSMMCQ